MQFAKETQVSVEKTQAEIAAVVRRYGADQYANGWRPGCAMIEFSIKKTHVRFILPLPDKSEKRFQVTPAGRRKHTAEQAYQAWEQACRQLWRALLLVIKAKLEAVECGITTFEHEFLAQIVMPNGMTIGDALVPRLTPILEGKLSLPMLEAP